MMGRWRGGEMGRWKDGDVETWRGEVMERWRGVTMETWRCGKTERWRDGEMERQRDGEVETWRHGEMERWRGGDRAMERWRGAPGPAVSSAFRACLHVSSHPPSSTPQGRAFCRYFFHGGKCSQCWCAARQGSLGTGMGHGGMGSGRSWGGGGQSLLSCLPLGLGRHLLCQDLMVCVGALGQALHIPCSGTPTMIPGPQLWFGSDFTDLALHSRQGAPGEGEGLRVLPVGAQQMHLCQCGRYGSMEGSSLPARPHLPEGPCGASSLVKSKWKMW